MTVNYVPMFALRFRDAAARALEQIQNTEFQMEVNIAHKIANYMYMKLYIMVTLTLISVFYSHGSMTLLWKPLVFTTA